MCRIHREATVLVVKHFPSSPRHHRIHGSSVTGISTTTPKALVTASRSGRHQTSSIFPDRNKGSSGGLPPRDPTARKSGLPSFISSGADGISTSLPMTEETRTIACGLYARKQIPRSDLMVNRSCLRRKDGPLTERCWNPVAICTFSGRDGPAQAMDGRIFTSRAWLTLKLFPPPASCSPGHRKIGNNIPCRSAKRPRSSAGREISSLCIRPAQAGHASIASGCS